MEKESVGQRFTQLIQQLGLSKNAFAMSLDKTATVIQHLVDERNKPGYDLICKVFEVYPNVSKDWLLLGDGPMLLNNANPPAETTVAVAPMVNPAKPLAATTAPGFPAPLFTVAAARPVAPAAPVVAPAEVEPPITPAAIAPQAPPAAIAPPVPDVAPAVSQPKKPSIGAELPVAALGSAALVAAAPPAPDATYLTAALHAQHLQHQLALAEQRNQHLLAQQQLMQQMLDLLKRPA